MPYSLGYARVSSLDQYETGFGRDAQIAALLRQPLPDTHPWGPKCFGPGAVPGLYCEEAASAYRVPFAKRRAAGELLRDANRGDRIVVLRLDRGFRSVGDFCTMLKEFERRKLTLECVAPQIDLSTATGRLLGHLLVAFAEWESAIKGERSKEAFAAKKLREAGGGSPQQKRLRTEPSDIWLWDDVAPAKIIQPSGRVFIYIRCSHVDSVKSGLGLEAQTFAARKFCQKLIEQNPSLAFGGLFSDKAVSAYSVDFGKRAAGGKLMAELKTGDHVVFARLDRAFRNLKDQANTLPLWLDAGINVHFVDQKINLNDGMGRVLVEAMTWAAQLEPMMSSLRHKEANAEAKRQRRYIGGASYGPLGGTVVRDEESGCKRIVLDRKYIAEMRLMHWYIRVLKKSGPWACNRLEAINAKREGRKPRCLAFCYDKKNPDRSDKPWHFRHAGERLKEYDRIMRIWYTSIAGSKPQPFYPVDATSPPAASRFSSVPEPPRGLACESSQ